MSTSGNMDGGSRIEVRLFAGIREVIGEESVWILCEPHATVRELKQAMARQYPETSSLVAASRVAIGNTFANDSDRLEEALEMGKTIAFIPPVSGG